MAIMNDFLTNRDPSRWFAKIDNDVIVPPGWLNNCLEIIERYPGVDLLGIEPKYEVGDFRRKAMITKHIGGIGLMRRAAFQTLPEARGRFGFTEWQHENPQVVKAWINPALPVILLDRLPFEPWASLSRDYEARGWQRPWRRYTEEDSKIWEWWRK